MRGFKLFCRDFAVFKELNRGVDAAHVKRFALFGQVPTADDEFRGGAADVDNQTLLGGRRERMRAARKHEARLFAARDDFDGVA